MACRTLELTLVSASDLRDVNLVSKLEVYAVVYLAGDPSSRHRVATDRAGGRNPAWNATVPLTVPASGAGSGSVRVLLRSERALGDRDVGEVLLPLPDLLAGAGDEPTAAKLASFPVRKVGSSRAHGVLNVSHKLTGVIYPDLAAHHPVAHTTGGGDPTAASHKAKPPTQNGFSWYPQAPPTPRPVRPMGLAGTSALACARSSGR